MKGKNDMRIKRKIGALVVLGMLGIIAFGSPVTADLDNLIWLRDDTGQDVSLSASYPNYDVGIGTDNPTAKLHVVGEVKIDSGDLNVDSGTLFVDESADRVGIGDTSPDFKLEVDGSSGSGYFGVTSSSDGDIFIIDSNDKIGIGTATPQQKLTLGTGNNFAVEMAICTGVSATATTGGTLGGPATYYIKVVASDGTGTTIGSSEVSRFIDGVSTNAIEVSWTGSQGASSYRIYVGISSGGQDRYHTDTASPFLLTAYGMGDGSTSGTVPTVTTAYVNKITASGDSWLLGGNIGIGTSGLGSNDRLTIRSAGDTNLYYGLRVQNSGGTDQFVVRSDGNVGIGTSAPMSKLGVVGGAVISSTWAASQPAPTNGLIVEGKVGFGTVGPDKALEINSNEGKNLRLTYNDFDGSAANFVDFETDNSGNLYVKPSGTGVCIGTPTPQAKLEVTDSAFSTYTGSPIGYFGTRTADTIALAGDSSSTPITLPTNLNIGVYGFGDDYGGYFKAQSTTGLKIGVYGEGQSFGGYFVGKGYFSDDVGIGTTPPSHKLEIYDTDTTNGRAGLYVDQIGAPAYGNTLYGIKVTKTGSGSGTNVAGYFSASGATNNYGLIVENGDVGIGLDDGPTEMLEVGGDACANNFKGRPSSNGQFLNNDETYGFVVEPGGQIFIGKTDTQTFKGINIAGDGTERVSIGAVTITHKLTITSTDEKTLRLIGPDDYGHGARLNFGDGDNVYIEEDEDDKLYIYSRVRTAIMGGNVGIGKDDPDTKLHVDGDVAFEQGSDLQISNYAVTATHAYHLIKAETGTSGELRTIMDGDVAGEILIIRAYAGHTITVKDGTGNLRLAGDFSMDDQDTMFLVFDGTVYWHEISRSEN